MEKEIKGVLLRVGGFEYELDMVTGQKKDIEQIEEEFTKLLNTAETLTIALKDGGSVNLGEGAVRSAVIILKY